MTRQEKFAIARKSLQMNFNTMLSYEVELNDDEDAYITNIFLDNIIISVGAYDYIEDDNLSTNDRYLESMLAAIGNYDTRLIPN